MNKAKHLHLLLLGIIVFRIVLMCNEGYADPGVKLKIDPDKRVVVTGSGEITIVAEPDSVKKSGLQFNWHLSGPGTLVGNMTDPGIFYIPPDKIDGESAQATITVVMHDDKGDKATDSVTFTLIGPKPTSPPTLPSIPIKVYIKGIGKPGQPANRQIVTVEIAEYLSDSKEVLIYPNQWSQAEFDLQLLSTAVSKLPGPSERLPQERLQQIHQRLSQYFETYQALMEKEQQGDNIDKQVIAILGNISKDMKEIEEIYEQVYEQIYEPLAKSATEMTQKMIRLRDTRKNFEYEISYRQRTSTP